MGRKRKKRSFCAVALEEENSMLQERCNKRKSSLAALGDFEKNVEDAGDVDFQCGQSKSINEDCPPQTGMALCPNREAESDIPNVEELFQDDFSRSHGSIGSPLSFLMLKQNEPAMNETRNDWDVVADRSAAIECSDGTKYFVKEQDCNLQCQQTHNDSGQKENDAISAKNSIAMDDFSRYSMNDTFGNIDFTQLENQIKNRKSTPNTPSTPKADPEHAAQESVTEKACHVPISTPVSKSLVKNAASPNMATTVNDFLLNPSQPVAASTPHRRGIKLKDQLIARLMANANQQTTTSFRLQDAMKIFPEIILELEQEAISEADMEATGPFYGLPAKVQDLMKSIRGIDRFYDWQHKCLTLKSVLQGRNLIYSLPTSGGKTLVAEMLIMKELLCKGRDAILVLPFVAIVQEKVRNIAEFADELDFLVEEYAGSKGKFPPTKRRKRKSLFICTIEKANSLVNSLIEAERLDDIGMVVVDELHMLGEGGRRGATIEMMLAKIMHVSNTTQVIGMSATLSNISDLAAFLKAEVYTNDFRPVALDEYVKFEDSIYRVDPKNLNPGERLNFERPISYANKEMSVRDTDHLATLVMEVVPEHSCLVFCATKKNCENVALMLSKLLPKQLHEHKGKEKQAILQTLYRDSGGEGICPTLVKTIPCGIAYHHSGLTADERRLIEEAYRDGVLCVIACTSTLAAGVNLPARRVIIRSPYVGRSFLSRSQYKQMAGRAGRAGVDTKGESFLILTKAQDKQRVLELVAGPVETCLSSLMYDGGKGFKTLLLNLIWLKVVTKLSDMKSFFNKTLTSIQLKTMPEKFSHFFAAAENAKEKSCESVEAVAKAALQELLDLKLIKLVKHVSESDSADGCDFADCSLEVTKLGVASNRGPIDLTICHGLYTDLKLGLKSLVLTTNLHLLYLVTPRDACENVKVNWMIYFEEYGKLTPDEQAAATVIGVPENFVALKAAGRRIRNKNYHEDVMCRFYVTLMLYLLFRGRSVWEVASRFEQPRGFLQNLISSSAAFASCTLHFTKELDEFWPYHALLEKLVQSLQYCTTAELLPLMEIPGVKVARAKQLFRAGFKTLALIAKAKPEDLMKNIEFLPRKQALQIIASSKILLKEKIEDLRAEVEELQKIPDI